MDYKREAIELPVHASQFPSLHGLCLVDFFDGVTI